MITLYVGECPMRYLCLIGRFCCCVTLKVMNLKANHNGAQRQYYS